MCGFNEAWRCRIIAESLAYLSNGNFEDGFAHEGAGPDGVEKFLFSDELARMSNQVAEYRESLRPELNHLRSSPQALVRKVQAKGVKDY